MHHIQWYANLVVEYTLLITHLYMYYIPWITLTCKGDIKTDRTYIVNCYSVLW